MREERITSATPITDFENAVVEKASCAKTAIVTAVVAMSIMAMPITAHAAGGLEESLKTAMNTIKSSIVHIAVPLYGLVAVICLIMIVASSGRKAEMAKDWLIRATIGMIAIGSLAAILSFVETQMGLSFK